jgi:hypothetical protein
MYPYILYSAEILNSKKLKPSPLLSNHYPDFYRWALLGVSVYIHRNIEFRNKTLHLKTQ